MLDSSMYSPFGSKPAQSLEIVRYRSKCYRGKERRHYVSRPAHSRRPCCGNRCCTPPSPYRPSLCLQSRGLLDGHCINDYDESQTCSRNHHRSKLPSLRSLSASHNYLLRKRIESYPKLS